MTIDSVRPDSRPPRLFELDLLRLVAALMVVAAHLISGLTEKQRSNLALGPIFDWGEPLATFGQFGVLGVDIFFIISGYVIALSAEGRTARAFAASRAARILPAFWFCCLTTWLVIKLNPAYRQVSLAQLFANLLFIARPLGYEFVDGVYWTLVIELQFYAMVTLLLWWRGMRVYPHFLSVWLVLAVVDFLGLTPWTIRFVTLSQYAPYFIAGGALYLIGKDRKSLWAHALGAGALLLICLKAGSRLPPLFPGQGWPAAVVLTLCYLALLLVATRRTVRFGRPWMAVAGALTYPLYLLHEDLGFLFMRHFPATGISWVDHRATITLLALATFLLAAHMVAACVERPVAPRVRRLIEGGRQSPPALKAAYSAAAPTPLSGADQGRCDGLD